MNSKSQLLPISTLVTRMRDEGALAIEQEFINPSPWFQRPYEAWTSTLKVGLIDTIMNGFALNPIWMIEDKNEEKWDVLDGQHRLLTIKDYMENKFCLCKKGLTLLSKEEYDKKFYKDLSKSDQSKIKNYLVHINILDSSNQDVDMIDYWYTKLNSTSMCLNDYERQKTKRATLYEFLNKYEDEFELAIHPHVTDTRGKLHETMLKYLCFCEEEIQSGTSNTDRMRKWVDKKFGKTKKEVDSNVIIYDKWLHSTMSRIKRYAKHFKDLGLFTEQLNDLYRLLVCCRTIALVPDEFLTRHGKQLATEFKHKVVNASDFILAQNMGLEKSNRNCQFQRELIKYVDSIIKSVLGKDLQSQRLFRHEDIIKKLEEQHNLCALCNKEISKEQTFEGDHIVPWHSGGDTKYDNLQVVHKLCHIKK